MAWFEKWFNTPYYHILYKDRDFAEAEEFISLLVNDLEIPKNSAIIDLACGKGRHSIYLDKLGYNVLGLDLSKESIFHNKEFETSAPLSLTKPYLKFEVHDMRDEIYPSVSKEKVDAVFNLFTSFGYFESENDDRKVFKSVHHSLKDHGYFVLDFLNEQWVKNKLVPEYVTTKGGIDFHIKKRIENRHVIKDISFKDKGKDYHFFEKVKLHTMEEIENYGAEFGFEKIKIYGDYQLGNFDLENSPRCITVFRKLEDGSPKSEDYKNMN